MSEEASFREPQVCFWATTIFLSFRLHIWSLAPDFIGYFCRKTFFTTPVAALLFLVLCVFYSHPSYSYLFTLYIFVYRLIFLAFGKGKRGTK